MLRDGGGSCLGSLVRVDGKSFRRGQHRFPFNGVTYGTFRGREDGARYPERRQVKADFAAMHDSGTREALIDAGGLHASLHSLQTGESGRPGSAPRHRPISLPHPPLPRFTPCETHEESRV